MATEMQIILDLKSINIAAFSTQGFQLNYERTCALPPKFLKGDLN